MSHGEVALGTAEDHREKASGSGFRGGMKKEGKEVMDVGDAKIIVGDHGKVVPEEG